MLVFPSRQIVRQTTVCRESNRCRLLTTTSINEGSRTPFVLPLESNQNKPLTEKQPITHVWQKWRCSTPLDIYCGIQHLFSASAFVVIIATFAKPQTVMMHCSFTVFKNLFITLNVHSFKKSSVCVFTMYFISYFFFTKVI